MIEPSLLAAIHAEAFADGERWDADAMASLLGMPGAFATLAPEGAGMALSRVAADEAELLTIAVRPGSRRLGIGRALLADAIAHCRALGANRLTLEVAEDNRAALAFYRSAGFVEIGRRRRYYRDGGTALVMGVTLPCGSAGG